MQTTPDEGTTTPRSEEAGASSKRAAKKSPDVSPYILSPFVAERAKAVAVSRRAASKDLTAQKLASTPYRFREQVTGNTSTMVIPRVSSENRPYLTKLNQK